MRAVRGLGPGDHVFHPRFGFGVIEGFQAREHDGVPTKYYSIRLNHGGVLTVPVARAEALGLRRLVNGLASITACLRTAARPLPRNPRERVLELGARWEALQPLVLAQAVRDLTGFGRAYGLTAGDKKWLARACERLSAEAAAVDAVDVEVARNAIARELDRIRSR